MPANPALSPGKARIAVRARSAVIVRPRSRKIHALVTAEVESNASNLVPKIRTTRPLYNPSAMRRWETSEVVPYRKFDELPVRLFVTKNWSGQATRYEYVRLSQSKGANRMNECKPILSLAGTLRLSTPDVNRTVGRFNQLITENGLVFKRYFGVDLFPGSLNIDVPAPDSLQSDLDTGRPPPAFVIPKGELINMPAYIGNGQAWPCILHGEKISGSVSCWVFRRIGSRVPPGVIEIVAQDKLRDVYDLQHGDAVAIDFLSPQACSGDSGVRRR